MQEKSLIRFRYLSSAEKMAKAREAVGPPELEDSRERTRMATGLRPTLLTPLLWKGQLGLPRSVLGGMQGKIYPTSRSP